MRLLICDLESNGLRYEVSRIWCIVCYDLISQTWHKFDRDEVEDGVKFLSNADKIVFHNGFNYDLSVLKKLYPWFTYKDTDDTFILSSLFEPDRSGGHSIENWGLKFGIHKPPDLDWTKYDPAMLHRCTEDVKIGIKVYQYLDKLRNQWDWDKSIRLEYACAKNQAQQETNGVKFDMEKANDLLNELDREIFLVSKKLLEELPLRCVRYGTEVKKPFKKDGKYSKMVTDWWSDRVDTTVLYPHHPRYRDIPVIKGPFTRIMWEEFNLNSSEQIKNYLLTQGWEPTQWNYKKDKAGRFIYDKRRQRIKTSPKLTEDSFSSIPDSEIPRLLARFNILNHRRNTVSNIKEPTAKGLIANVRDDGRIEAQGIPQATNTGRFRHRIVVNIPAAEDKVLYGKHIRELFTVDPGNNMVGVDAKGLEARTNAHYCYPFPGGKEHADILINGDIHEKNAKTFGCSRKEAKSPYYALVN